MRVTWEAVDIQVGRIVRAPTDAHNRNYMVTYTVSSDGNTYGLVYLADGQVVMDGMTRGQLAARLNIDGYLPTDDDRDISKAADTLRGIRP